MKKDIILCKAKLVQVNKQYYCPEYICDACPILQKPQEKKEPDSEKWCPLTGETELPDDSIMMRARGVWGVENIVKGDVLHSYRPGRDAFERAGRIYARCFELWEESTLSFCLKMAVSAPNRGMREMYADDVLSFFKGSNPDAKPFEVFSIIIIYIKQMQANLEFTSAVLSLAEQYSSDALRGKKVIEGAKTSGTARRYQVQEERGEIWGALQAQANEIWNSNPSLPKIEVARMIRQKDSSAPSITTIRTRIKKP